MGCFSCAQKAAQAQSSPKPIVQGECGYTVEIVNAWKTAVFCVRDNGYNNQLGISDSLLNKMLGIILSALNMQNNICYFRDKLDSIKPQILIIANSNLCP